MSRPILLFRFSPRYFFLPLPGFLVGHCTFLFRCTDSSRIISLLLRRRPQRISFQIFPSSLNSFVPLRSMAPAPLCLSCRALLLPRVGLLYTRLLNPRRPPTRPGSLLTTGLLVAEFPYLPPLDRPEVSARCPTEKSFFSSPSRTAVTFLSFCFFPLMAPGRVH